jgi:hypothetical protein
MEVAKPNLFHLTKVAKLKMKISPSLKGHFFLVVLVVEVVRNERKLKPSVAAHSLQISPLLPTSPGVSESPPTKI